MRRSGTREVTGVGDRPGGDDDRREHHGPVGQHQEVLRDKGLRVGAQPVTEPGEDDAAAGTHLRIDQALLHTSQPGAGLPPSLYRFSIHPAVVAFRGRRRATGPNHDGHHLGRQQGAGT
ncbi:hypothetical protein [Actinoplanes flavus]|uniref:Uncharacterized protein n=1 Tax=Actinoplanes flavus TaxID=2820290 RepID=A0ABS3UH36_9ACTN|nr:hypothetical protein [Actinoplanes flavus]MBO3737506.1 hypothetical protein [Actinoplanes flavus]